MKELIIGRNDAGQRLDKYLSKALPALPPSLMQKYIRLKRIKLAGKRVEKDYRLQEGDVLQLYINDEFFLLPDPNEVWRKAPTALEIAYEDEHVLVIDKPAGLVVHEDEQGSVDTLINRIKAYLYKKGEWDPESERSFVPALCNRIDRNTGGLVIAAKTAEALRVLNQKIKDREITKYYLCLVHGTPKPAAGTLKHYLCRDTDKKQVFVQQRKTSDNLTAVLRYRTLEKRGELSLLECELVTGRTHQIRAQMQAAGWPLAGDTKYGTATQNRGLPFSHQALWSWRLCFSFTTPAGPLEYLRGKEVRAKEVPFLKFFWELPKKSN
ncbi:MAG: RluA family pseudouridine synthase [Clostridia bacterium]|nr:RluA family pseudouridine synthase [Clostridia bacterium]